MKKGADDGALSGRGHPHRRRATITQERKGHRGKTLRGYTPTAFPVYQKGRQDDG